MSAGSWLGHVLGGSVALSGAGYGRGAGEGMWKAAAPCLPRGLLSQAGILVDVTEPQSHLSFPAPTHPQEEAEL